MKRLYVYLLVHVFLFELSAQTFPLSGIQRKSGLFTQLPDSITVDIPSLEALLRLSAGSEISMDISSTGRLPIQATVISTSEKYNGRIHSMSLRATGYEGAVLHLSKTILENGKIQFRGTWVHREFEEIFVLAPQGQEYALVKKKFNEVFME
jgi:hypothetical protein